MKGFIQYRLVKLIFSANKKQPVTIYFAHFVEKLNTVREASVLFILMDITKVSNVEIIIMARINHVTTIFLHPYFKQKSRTF